MKLPDNYYHCFLGNGLDAVLVGYSGSMIPDKVGVDRCAWYKSDRYYPENKLVMVAGRFPMDKKLEHAAGSAWFEIAPLGHTWYEVRVNHEYLEIQSSHQSFDPQQGLLRSELDFGLVHAQAVTFLHAQESLLVERYEFSEEVEFQAWFAPGVWVEEGWDTDPFLKVSMDTENPSGNYDLGETHGKYFLNVDPVAQGVLVNENDRGCVTRGRVITKYFSILDNRQGVLTPDRFTKLVSDGYESLLARHKQSWQIYFSRSCITIPDAQFQSFYDFSLYHFKAAQSRISGGLPVNNLRRTWSSHIFWDSYFIQRALLEANRIEESREACRFFQHTVDQARRHAQEEFGCAGLKWDWEITHKGRKAYGTLLHMKFQVHNNASYSNEIWQHYLFTGDIAYLAEVYSILEGLATFFMEGIVEKTSRGWEIGPLVGVHESPIKVKNEGMSLAGTIVILEHCAEAARLLGRETEFTQRCQEVANGLRHTLELLFNGNYFVSAEGASNLNMSSMGVIYPMQVIPFEDPRAVSTAHAMLEYNNSRTNKDGKYHNFPWSWGVLGTILACQGKGEEAWKVIQNTRHTICEFGGMTEVMEDKTWNMQYFLTAQAAVVTALHNLLLQSSGDTVDIFTALPNDWQVCSFERLLSCGLEISASYNHGQITGQLKNITPRTLERTARFGQEAETFRLEPEETYAFQSSK